MKQHTRGLFPAVLAILTLAVASPSAQRGQTSQTAPSAAPVQAPAPAAPAPAARPERATPPATASPASAASQPAKPATALFPRTKKVQSWQVVTGRAPFNVRVEVLVTDRLESKVLSQETFTAVVQPASMAKISRLTGPASGALELTADRIQGETVIMTVGSEFRLRPGTAGEKDQGVTVGQNVTSAVVFGKPATVIDMSTDAEGRRRFAVQVTVTKVPVE